MNSLKSIAKMEDEVSVITSIYVTNINNLLYNPFPNHTQKQFFYIHRVEEALSSLDERHRELIEKDFIIQEPKWWKTSYSDLLYLHMRYQAVGSFLMHFYGN